MRTRLAVLFTALILVLLAAWASRQTTTEDPLQRVFQSEPQGVMGTVCKLVLVTDRYPPESANEILGAAEAELRRQEALLSTWIESSQMSRLNAAAAGEQILPATEVSEILTLARDLHIATDGAFDITARPLIELWRHAGDQGLLPAREDLDTARAESTWDHLHLTADGIRKGLATARVDVDGIAKGYAIDRALEVLQRSGAQGGMVEVGGDLRVFGRGPAAGEGWNVAIRSPFDAIVWAEIEMRDGAVCSSGDYARFVEIEGRRFGHIIDPRSGWPTEETRAVTVIGPDAATADAWATALSILGVEGLDLLRTRDDLEAMVVTGSPEDYRVMTTPGFRRRILRADFDLAD